MKMRHFSPLFCVLLMVGMFSDASAQTKKGIILYNSVPYLAEYTAEGKVVELIEKKPNYLKGYDLVTSSYTNTSPNLIADNQSTRPSTPSNTAPISTVSASRKFIDFDGDNATLTDISLKRLLAIKEHLDKNPNSRVMIVAHKVDNSERVATLASNRLDSCHRYLEINGVDNSRIITNSVYAPSLAQKVAITYVQ